MPLLRDADPGGLVLSRSATAPVLSRALSVAVVVVGFTALLSQVALARELLDVFLGNELTIGLVLAVWLLLVAAGSGLVGRWVARPQRTPAAFAALQLLLVVALPLEIVAARRLGFQSALPGEIPPPPQVILGAVEVLALPCLILGAQFALACRLATREPGVRGVARVYLLEAIGTVAGGLFFHWAAADYLSVFQVMGIVAGANALSAGWVLVEARRPAAVMAAVAGAAWCAALVANAGRWEMASLRARPHWAALNLVRVENSKFGRIAVTRRMGQTSLFQSGVLLFTSEDREANEAAVHLALLQHPHPRRVLLLGSGVSGAVGEVLKHPVERVEYVELDPRVVSTARAVLPAALTAPLRDPRVRLRVGDARLALRSARGAYDVIIVNLPDPTTALLSRFYTVEFYREARRALSSSGIVLARISSSETFIGSELVELDLSVIHAMRAAFPSVVTVPGETMFLIGSCRRGGVTGDAGALGRRLTARRIRNDYVTPFWIAERLLPFRVEMIRQALARGGPVPANRDFRPVAYYYQAKLWLREMAPALRPLMRAASAVRLWWFAAMLAAAGIAAALLGRRRGYRAPALALAVMATGAAAMALEIAALLAFQVTRGYLYHQLGALIAAFMAGLAVGVLWAGRRLDRAPGDAGKVCAGAMAGLAILAALFLIVVGPIARHPDAASWVLGGVLFAGGALVAAAFPAAAGLYAAGGDRVAASAATLYAADLAGAAGGALLTSLVLIPVLGMAATAIAAGLWAVTAAVLSGPFIAPTPA